MPKYLPQRPVLKHPEPMFLPHVKDQVLHPTGKITAPYIVIFILLDIKLEAKDSAPNGSQHSLTFSLMQF